MDHREKLERWAELLLDTGKRNQLISFKDAKSSSAEVIFPDIEAVFSKCSVGQSFTLFDPKIAESEEETEDTQTGEEEQAPDREKLNRQAFLERYSPQVKKGQLLVYAQTDNPLTAVKNIAKKAQTELEEAGNNVAYLAFGFVRWNEREGSETFYRAPLLLVPVTLSTGTILDPIRLEIADDDIVVNPTFDHLLQADHGLSLPVFQDGDTLTSYLDRVSERFARLHWTVLRECKLGIFSFLKINMYQDLKQNAALMLENPNVQLLLGESVTEHLSADGDGKRVENALIDLHTVVDADSSQIEAIEMAKSGRSFVLQGPPGTGKSQTITNIIAECLYDGKKVLFVSEKQAALNVVYEKLKQAGLSEFCLELHSHKANKRAVIETLNRTMEMPKRKVSGAAQEEIRQKRVAQEKLDGYARALHEKRESIGQSLYQLMEHYAALRQFPEVSFSLREIDRKGQDYLLRATALLEQYVAFLPSVGEDFRQNPWYGFQSDSLSYEERNQLRTDLKTLADGYESLKAETVRIRETYETPELTLADTRYWQNLLQFCGSSVALTPALLSETALEQSFSQFTQMQELSGRILSLSGELEQRFSPRMVEELDGQDCYNQLTGPYSSFFTRLFNGGYKALMGLLRSYTHSGEKLSYQQAVDGMAALMRLQSLNANFAELEETVGVQLGVGYHGFQTDWAKVMSELEELRTIQQDSASSFGLLSRMERTPFLDRREQFSADAEKLQGELEEISGAKERLSARFSEETLDLEQGSYTACIDKLHSCLEDFDKLGNWIRFQALLEQLCEAELMGYLDTAIADHIPPDSIVGAWQREFYHQWIESILFSVPELAAFSRTVQDQAVRTFAQKDELQFEISKGEIQSELSQNRPNLDLTAGGSAVAVLRREGQKKRKQMPIRRLLSETGSLVQLLKPCFLMSPLSVSTYLDPERITFDTVVFDEASQIFPQDAIGAIYRGKQLIVVGDSRQMPPSLYFTAQSDTEDADEDDIGNYESILDVCAAVFSTKRLSWHYRSHYEQLIAFSNLHYYNNTLITFPSASQDHRGIGVDYYHVDGVFDRKSKTNRAEAEFIVERIYQHIQEHPERSLGVVAFSLSQQELIDRLLSKRRESDPAQEWFFRTDRPEPFFVKNLETVQGDERDTILFSVAYARDAQGRFLHNFGPLNREGGERRLNVAVTRAKDNVQLVASIHCTDIDLSRTGSEGAKLLRAYLDYAEHGEQALERSITVSDRDVYDSDFEQEVCDFLREHGFTVDTQVGCSGYRIDLGIRRPDSSRYVLAVECDGATYHSSRNARDRDRLRQQVLERMGWQFYRIWSTDWFRNGVVERERLLTAAKEAVRQAELPEQTSQVKPPQAEQQRQFTWEDSKPKSAFPAYRAVNALAVMQANPFDFQKALVEILKVEAPLSEEYLLKRIVTLFGREKVTKVVQQSFEYRLRRCHEKGILRRDGFLYLPEKDDLELRIPGERREIKYISLEELSAGIYALIQQNITASREGIYKTLNNLLGFSRRGETITARYEAALSALLEQGRVTEADGLLMVRDAGEGKEEQA